jgi:hypothetical protein
VLISPPGSRLLYCNVHATWKKLAAAAGLRPRSDNCRPRIHDLRHAFAVRTMLDAYEAGQDGQATLAVLSTYLGHVNPKATYWYQLAQKLGRTPADADLARYLGVSRNELRHAPRAELAFQPFSLYAPLAGQPRHQHPGGPARGAGSAAEAHAQHARRRSALG